MCEGKVEWLCYGEIGQLQAFQPDPQQEFSGIFTGERLRAVKETRSSMMISRTRGGAGRPTNRTYRLQLCVFAVNIDLMGKAMKPLPPEPGLSECGLRGASILFAQVGQAERGC